MNQEEFNTFKREADKKERAAKRSIKTMDLILLVIGIGVIVFIVKMISLFEIYQMVPDTLIVSFFGAVIGECSVMGFIQKEKERKESAISELQLKKEMLQNELKEGDE